MSLTLVIGNKNYSSWSLRPWLYLKHHGLAFEEVRISLYREDSKAKILAHSPAGKVPVLIDGDLAVWDSLAILEYLAERFPETAGWPRLPSDRARARSLSAEMHSGFLALRTHCGMNCRRPPAVKAVPEAVYQDVARIGQIWRDCRERFAGEGPWLFGRFTIADAMYAPVALRFATYRLEAGPVAAEYVSTVLGHPAMWEWMEAGRAEIEVIPAFED
ncbi:glutathione S-transferase family protein [Methylococcus sp. Mc7]|uniref:glutathione S-transferase family protein n=1 Tax=Methylococcus sp. Mc7 TaxID=2860258 RepID=UPI001C52BCC1|nr:glutathione S-transferase family protein [Methylococcus sp. Mc7]QXP84205.1 glutathione S-transferase family protein [Methylococcus sp. Mc7]